MRRAKLAEDGMSAHDVIELCQSLGQHPRAIVGPVSALAELPVPSILVIDDRHCVVYDGMDGPTHARIFEPVTLRSGLESREWLSQHWTGEAIVFADVKPTHGRAMFQAVSAASLTLLVGWGIHRGFKGVVNMRLRRLAHD